MDMKYLKVKTAEIESIMVVSRSWGEGDMENYCSMAMEFQFRTTKDF